VSTDEDLAATNRAIIASTERQW